MSKTKKTNKEETKEIKLSPIELSTIKVIVKGKSLLMNRMNPETMEDMTRKQTGQTVEKKKIRDLYKEVEMKKHFTSNGKIGFPACAFKSAMVEGAVYIDSLDKKRVKGSVQVLGDILPLKYKTEKINKATTYDSGINRSPRETWRPQYDDWSCELTIQFNKSQISASQIVELLKIAGFHIGIGSWSPQHSGNFGMFQVASSEQ